MYLFYFLFPIQCLYAFIFIDDTSNDDEHIEIVIVGSIDEGWQKEKETTNINSKLISI